MSRSTLVNAHEHEDKSMGHKSCVIFHPSDPYRERAFLGITREFVGRFFRGMRLLSFTVVPYHAWTFAKLSHVDGKKRVFFPEDLKNRHLYA